MDFAGERLKNASVGQSHKKLCWLLVGTHGLRDHVRSITGKIRIRCSIRIDKMDVDHMNGLWRIDPRKDLDI